MKRGTLAIEDEMATITFHRVLRHTPEHVWEAIATPEGLKEWLLCTHAVIEGKTGGSIEMVSGPAKYHSKGKILRWDPPRLFEYEWKVDPVPEMPLGENAIFRYELEPEEGGTHLTVIYRRITKRTAPGFLPGLHAFLDRLEAQLDGVPLPDWMARFAAVRDAYPEWNDATASGK